MEDHTRRAFALLDLPNGNLVILKFRDWVFRVYLLLMRWYIFLFIRLIWLIGNLGEKKRTTPLGTRCRSLKNKKTTYLTKYIIIYIGTASVCSTMSWPKWFNIIKVSWMKNVILTEIVCAVRFLVSSGKSALVG